MHPEPFLPLACGVRDPAGAAGRAGEGSCPLARALPCSAVPCQPGGAGDAAGLDTAARAAAGNPGSGAAGRPAAALLQGLLSHDVSGHELSGLLLQWLGGAAESVVLLESRVLASMRAVLELQPGRTMGSLEQRAVPGLPAVGQPHGILPCPTRLATNPASCFQPSLCMGMASWGPAGLRRGWVIPQPIFHMPTAPGRRTHGLRSSLKAQAATASRRFRVRSWRGGLKGSSRSLRHWQHQGSSWCLRSTT